MRYNKADSVRLCAELAFFDRKGKHEHRSNTCGRNRK